MHPAVQSLIAAASIMLVSLSGIVFARQTLGDWMSSRLTYLATFSAGVLSMLSYHLVRESLDQSSSGGLAVAAILFGVIVMEAIHHLLPDQHHHHEIPADHPHTPIDGRRVLLSDAVHNVTDGFIIVPAFFVDWTIGVGATIGILLHELVQEVSEFFVLRQAGYDTKRALSLSFISSSTILIGVALALILTSFETLLALLAGFAAGGFLSSIVRDLLPHAVESARTHRSWPLHILAGLAGACVMLGVMTAFPR